MMMAEKAADLTALVAGIRSHPGKEEEYINARVREIRREIQHGSRAEKSEAVLKLWYLSMMGYDISWASFAIVEVMSLPTLALKRPGFFASAACFNDETPVALLTINLLKKSLMQTSELASTLMTLSCLASMATSDIARDLHSDILTLLVSSKPSLRRKAVLCLFRMFLKYPPALLTCYPRLKDLLKDPEGSVVTATVSVLLELAQRNAANYIRLVPTLYKRLETPSSNWESIKLLRLLRTLCPLEPRLAPKLQELLTTMLHDAKTARSVEFEILRLILDCYPPSVPLVRECISRVKTVYFESTDMNLKCLGLTLLASAAQVSENMLQLLYDVFGKELLTQVLAFVSSSDSILRNAALSVVRRCINMHNFPSVCQNLLKLSKEADSSRSTDFLITLLQLGEQNHFSLVDDVQEYVGILVRVAQRPLTAEARATVIHQLKNLAQDIPTLRPYLLRAISMFLWRRPADWSTAPKTAKPPPPLLEKVRFQGNGEKHQGADGLAGYHRENKAGNEKDLPVPLCSGSGPETLHSTVSEEGVYRPEVGLIPEGHPSCVSDDVIEVTLSLYGRYYNELTQSLRDTADVTALIGLAEDICDPSARNLEDFRKMLLAGQSHGPAFVYFLSRYLVATAQSALLSSVLRCMAAVNFLKLLCVLAEESPSDCKSLLGALGELAQHCADSSSPGLRIISKLLRLIDSGFSSVPDAMAFLSQSRAGWDGTGLTEQRAVASADDFKDPFFEALGRPTGTHQRKKHEYVRSWDKTTEPATTTETDQPDPLQYRGKIWQTLMNDGTLVVYAAVVGRSVHPGSTTLLQERQANFSTIHSSYVDITVDFRCENLNDSALLNIEIQQLDTTKKVLLAQRLVSRSKKISAVLSMTREMLFYGAGEASAVCRISYRTNENPDEPVRQLLVPLHVPVYHVFQPLPLDEDAAAAIIKTQPSSVSAKATVTRRDGTVPLSSQPFADTVAKSLHIAACIANLHIISRPTDSSERVTALLVGREWCPDADVLEGLAQMSLPPHSSHQGSSLPLGFPDATALGVTTVVFGFVSCTLTSASPDTPVADNSSSSCQHVAVTVTTRTNDPQISERCTTDLCNLIIDVFRNSILPL